MVAYGDHRNDADQRHNADELGYEFGVLDEESGLGEFLVDCSEDVVEADVDEPELG